MLTHPFSPLRERNSVFAPPTQQGRERCAPRTPCGVVAALVALAIISNTARPCFAAGSPQPSAGALSVYPAELNLRIDAPVANSAGSLLGPAHQQLAVSQNGDSLSARDLTRQARYTPANPDICQVSPSGLVTPLAVGKTTITISADGKTAAVPVTVVERTSPAVVSYRLDVNPLLTKAGCNQGTCHGNLNGKGGFRLSLRGDDPLFDRQMITRDMMGRRINRRQAEESLLVRKGAALLPHEGGKRLDAQSPEFKTLALWIASGAEDDEKTAPAIRNLTVFPSERILTEPDHAQQMVVMAEFADGSHRDVTRQASYDSSAPTSLQIDASGQVICDSPVDATVSVRYGTARATARLTFLENRPGFVWNGMKGQGIVDRPVAQKLEQMRINPSARSSDATFLRRAYLTALGVLPTSKEARAFLQDTDPNKRTKLVDQLLQRPEFNDYWALKWADILRLDERAVGTKGTILFHQWLVKAVAEDRPLDELAREIIVATGSTWDNPPASFYRALKEETVTAEALSQVFLGYRLQCAKCHNHPFDVWTQEDYYGFAAYFAPLERKIVDPKIQDRFDKNRLVGDVVIELKGEATLEHPASKKMLKATPLGGWSDHPPKSPQSLDALADWLVANPQFARNIANRVWFHAFGQGIVDPPDDFRDSNPPSNPELLEALADSLRQNKMKLRPLLREIMMSETFQFDAVPTASNADDETNFSHFPVRVLPAEPLLDAICQVTEVGAHFNLKPRRKSPDMEEAFALLKDNVNKDGITKGLRATQIAGVESTTPFLTTFGKSPRQLTCECERSSGITLAQALQMLNGTDVRDRLQKPENRVGRLLREKKSNEQIVDELYLVSLSRFPRPEEKSQMLAYLDNAKDRRAACDDLLWALLNSNEFLLLH